MNKTIVVLLRRTSKWDHDKPVRQQAYWDDHARFMDALFDAGTVELAGPFEDGSGSMVILAAESVEAARAMFLQDPWTQQDILVAAEIKEWTIFLDSRNKGHA
jgi:uncharacterized protein